MDSQRKNLERVTKGPVRGAFVLSLCLLAACASKNTITQQRSSAPNEATPTKSEAVQDLRPPTPAPAPVAEAPAPAPVVEGVTAVAPGATTPVAPVELPPPALAPNKSFAVWIDGAGLEAIAALGFLQELEKAGWKPAKVVGTGFGCWVAISWAIENSGNSGEWQTFKWTSWEHLPRSGLLGKLTGGTSRKKFEEDMHRLLPVQNFEKLALPADCAVVTASQPSHLVSGRSSDLTSALWQQFQLPVLGVEKIEGTVYSGLAAGTPLPAELEAFSAGIDRSKAPFAGWIVLRTRTAQERAGSKGWEEVMAERSDAAVPASGTLGDGTRWVLVDLAPRGRDASEVQKFEKRREWLLEGRRVGNTFLNRDENKIFFH
ncbi:MAG: hypothetical protein JST16_07295 [Bdellovibrionales bacterium]|nr:hypothetical protein [Bdellovibrionales bacterium]